MAKGQTRPSDEAEELERTRVPVGAPASLTINSVGADAHLKEA